MATNRFGLSAQQRLDQLRYSDNATALDIGRAEFDVWYETEALPAYERLVELEKSVKDSYPKIQEKVEVLDGSRNLQSRPRAAVRFEDMRHIANLPSIPPKARRVTGPVTAEQYNALVDDVAALYSALGALASVIKRQLP